MKSENRSSVFKNLALVSQIGISMIVPILGGIFLGNLIDKRLGTGIIFLVIFTIVGIMASFVSLFKMATKDVDKRK